MQTRILDRFSNDLDEVVLDSPQATFYHTGAWIDSLSLVYPGMQFRCVAVEDGGRIAGCLPFFVLKRGPARALWSLPFGTYGGPVVRGDAMGVGVEDRLLAKYASLRRGWGVQEVGLVDFSSSITEGFFSVDVSSTHILDLDGGFDAVWNDRFEKSKRRQARKAKREGLSVVEAASVSDVKNYYAIYEERSRQWGQRLRYPASLFVELFARGKGGVRLFLAYRGSELFGGHFNFYFKDSVIAWNGVARDSGTGTQASTLLYCECIRDACERGFKRYNLGSSLGKTTLVGYKESLGATAHGYRTAIWRSVGGKITSMLMRLLTRS
jgi:CelD/BcsL family acetyltransferase involved in cellulose biosynthesis